MNRPASPPLWKVEARHAISLGDGRGMILRPLVAGDADAMEEFFAALSEREIYYFFGLEAEAARRLAEDVAHDPSYRLVAVCELGGSEQILGYVFLHWSDLELPPTFGICVRDGAQSAGLGRAMIDLLLASASASGVSRARLTVHPDNWRALRLYQRFGFRLVDEFINRHQQVKQYCMEADLLAPYASIDESLTVVPVGGLGVGCAAARVQHALARRTGRLPLILDRPGNTGCRVVYVVDLGSVDRFPIGVPAIPAAEDFEWVTALDERHLLLAGSGRSALERSVARYLASLTDEGETDETAPGFGGVRGHRDL
jgi:ribosomal protein S18 acetylase RimI-like enzyme